jgi:hypothetical protein
LPVFQEYLIVPEGQVFGSRSAPSFFSLTSDVRAYIATTHDLQADSLTPLAATAEIEPLPATWNPLVDLTLACSDPLYAPLSTNEHAWCFLNSMFADDKMVWQLIERTFKWLSIRP